MRKAIALSAVVALFLGLGISVFADNEKSVKAPAKVTAKKGFCPQAAAKLAVSVRASKCDVTAAKLLVSGIPSLKCERSAATLVKSIRAAGCEKSATALIVKSIDGCASASGKTKLQVAARRASVPRPQPSSPSASAPPSAT